MYSHYKYKNYCYDSSNKQIINSVTNKTIKQSLHHTGYKVISIYDEVSNKYVQFRVHRFIMECYLQREIKPNYVINHIDGNKLNNSITNLEEITPKENTIHAFKLGLLRPLKGVKNGNAKISEEDVKEIIRLIIKGKSNLEIGQQFNLDYKHISLIRHKKRWKHIFNSEEFKDYVPILSKRK